MRSVITTALAAIAISGCIDDPPGLHVVVHDEHAGAYSVDMYYVAKQVTDVDGMTPEGATKEMQGTVLQLDSAVPQSNGVLHGGKTVFDILPRTDGDKLDVPLLVFLGRDESNAVVSFGMIDELSVKAGGAKLIRTDLDQQAFTFGGPSDDHIPSGTRVYEWAQPNADGSRVKCTDIEFAEDSPTGIVRHYFLLPPDDSDCDGRLATANVCPAEDDLLWDPSRPSVMTPAPLLERATCGQETQAVGGGMNQDVCALGAPPPATCIDGSIGDCLGFAGPRYCAPIKMCQQDECLDDPMGCAGHSTPFDDWARPNQGGTFLDCTVAFQPDGSACPGNGGSSASFNIADALHLKFPDLPQVNCADANLWVPRETPARSAFFYQDATTRPKFALDAVSSSCQTSLVYKGGAKPDPDMVTGLYAYGAIDARVGVGAVLPTDHIVMPVRVFFDDCNQMTSRCVLVRGSDDDEVSLSKCIR